MLTMSEKEAYLLDACENAYLYLLTAPHDMRRTTNQRLYCQLRDVIAAANGLDAEDVQNAFEERAFALRAIPC